IATVNGEAVSTVEVPANGTASITVTLDVSEADGQLSEFFPNGYWLEGFVTLTDPSDVNPELHVPYVGFKGEWDSSPIVDKPVWDEEKYYGMSGVLKKIREIEDRNMRNRFNRTNIKTSQVDRENNTYSTDGD